MEEYDQDEWKKILKSYAKLKAAVKDEIDCLDNADKGKEEERDEDTKNEDFLDFIYELKHVLNEKDLEMVEKYVVKEAEKKENSKYVDYDEAVKDSKDFIEKVNELNEDFHWSDEKIKCQVESMLCYGSQVINPQTIKFIRELKLPNHKTVR